jgi:hypothetical protein
MDSLSKNDLIGKKIIFYRIKKPLHEFQTAADIEALFGWWNISQERASTADYLMLIHHDRILEVRKILDWVNSPDQPSRIKCTSDPTDNLAALVGKSIKSLYNPRDKSILRFYNC